MSYLVEREARKSVHTKWIVIFAVCCTVCAVMLCGHKPVQAQNRATTVDQAYLPIQPQALKGELLKSGHDPVELYNLVRRADHQGLADVAYDTLNKMRREQPGNAVALAGYCFAYQVAVGDYDNPDRKNHPFTEAEHKSYTGTLNRAYQLDPKLWLTYTVEGHTLMPSPYEDVKALRLLKTAVRLAPDVSYTHILLAEAYGVYGTPYHSFQFAAKECDIARHLKPVSTRNADILFDTYDIRMPNREKAADAKRYLLSTLPPGYKLSPEFRERLAKY